MITICNHRMYTFANSLSIKRSHSMITFISVKRCKSAVNPKSVYGMIVCIVYIRYTPRWFMFSQADYITKHLTLSSLRFPSTFVCYVYNVDVSC